MFQLAVNKNSTIVSNELRPTYQIEGNYKFMTIILMLNKKNLHFNKLQIFKHPWPFPPPPPQKKKEERKLYVHSSIITLSMALNYQSFFLSLFFLGGGGGGGGGGEEGFTPLGNH